MNERLFVSGKLPQFDAAVAQRDGATVGRLLREVDVDEESIDNILRRMGLER